MIETFGRERRMSVADQYPGDCRIPVECGVTVRLSPEFAGSLSTDVQGASLPGSPPPTQAAGLVFGTTENDFITVRAFRTFAFWDALQSNSPSAEAGLNGLELIGWFCAR